jgi:hypothetical protein
VGVESREVHCYADGGFDLIEKLEPDRDAGLVAQADEDVDVCDVGRKGEGCESSVGEADDFTIGEIG